MSALQPTAFDIQRVNAATLDSVATFFAESFWLQSTTFDAVQLNDRERKQLEKRMSEEFDSRYAIEKRREGQLFPGRLLCACEPNKGAIVGCVGVEAALFELSSGTVLPSASAEAVLRQCIDLLDPDEADRVGDVYRDRGIGALVNELCPEFLPVALLANLAVAPAMRRTGLGRELCELCEAGSAEWSMPGMMLQVEEANTAARSLYESLGYEAVRVDDNGFAVRLNPNEQTLASALLLVESAELLQERPSTIVTMAKQAVLSEE